MDIINMDMVLTLWVLLFLIAFVGLFRLIAKYINSFYLSLFSLFASLLLGYYFIPIIVYDVMEALMGGKGR
jgi:hypothetical protein